MNMGIEKWKRYLYPFGDITASRKDEDDSEAKYRSLGINRSQNISQHQDSICSSESPHFAQPLGDENEFI